MGPEKYEAGNVRDENVESAGFFHVYDGERYEESAGPGLEECSNAGDGMGRGLEWSMTSSMRDCAEKVVEMDRTAERSLILS